MTRTLLIMTPLPEEQMAQLEQNYTMHRLWKSKDPEALLNSIKEDVQGVVTMLGVKVSDKLIRALPNLEIIANWGVGTDNIDVKTAKERGVIVTNTPGVLVDDTADLAIGLILAVKRRMVEGDIYVRTGQWAKKGDMPLGHSLGGCTVGIVGLGRIGRAVARRAEVFGMKVVWHGPRQKPGIAWPHYSDLCNMAEICDILVLSCTYSDKTHHLVNGKVLRALGNKGILINVARGNVVDEQGLIDALEGGVIAGAGLDVFAQEPDVPSALCRLDNVVLQPHLSGATHEARESSAQLVVDNLALYFEKAEVLTAV